MDIADLIAPQAVLDGVRFPDKRAVLAHIAARLSVSAGLDADNILDCILQREMLGTTALGGGTAIPHAKLPGLGAPVAALARLETPVDFGALDGLPVDLVVMLLAPGAAGADHLKALAGISRLLRDAPLVAKLRGAVSGDALYALIAGDRHRRAA